MPAKGTKLSLESRKKISLHHADISGNKNPRWKGGKIYNDVGYVLVYKPNHPFATDLGYVREHRLVVEENLGRYLRPDEVIHHKNRVKDDNRIENLEVTNASEHSKIHSPEIIHPRGKLKYKMLLSAILNLHRWGFNNREIERLLSKFICPINHETIRYYVNHYPQRI